MKKLTLFILVFSVLCLNIGAQTIQIPKNLPQGHPRVLTSTSTKDSVKLLIKKELWAKEVFDKIKTRTDKYADQHINDPNWLVSRLQMYWKTHCTDVFIPVHVLPQQFLVAQNWKILLLLWMMRKACFLSIIRKLTNL